LPNQSTILIQAVCFERYIRICFYCQLRETYVLSDENVKFYKLFIVIFPILFYIPKFFEVRSHYVDYPPTFREADCNKLTRLKIPKVEFPPGHNFTEQELHNQAASYIINKMANGCREILLQEQQEYGVGKLEKELNTTGILMRNVTIRAAKSKGEIVQSDLRKNPYYFKIYFVYLNTFFASLLPLALLLFFNISTAVQLIKMSRMETRALAASARHNSLRRRSTRIDSRPSLATIATRIDLESRRASIAVTSALSTAARRAATTSGPVRNGVARKFSFVGDNASSQSAANGGPNGGGTASSSTIELKRRMMNFFERKSSTGSNNHQSHVNSINNSLRGGFNRQSSSTNTVTTSLHHHPVCSKHDSSADGCGGGGDSSSGSPKNSSQQHNQSSSPFCNNTSSLPRSASLKDLRKVRRSYRPSLDSSGNERDGEEEEEEEDEAEPKALSNSQTTPLLMLNTPTSSGQQPQKSISCGEQINLMTVQENPLTADAHQRCHTNAFLSSNDGDPGSLDVGGRRVQPPTALNNAFKMHNCTKSPDDLPRNGSSSEINSGGTAFRKSTRIPNGTTGERYFRVGSDESYPVDSEGEEEVIASNVLPDIVNHLLTSSSGVETACEMTDVNSENHFALQSKKACSLTSSSDKRANAQQHTEVRQPLLNHQPNESSIVDVKRVSCYHSVGPTTPSTTGLALSGGGGGIKAPPPSLLASRRPTTLPILEESSPVSTPTVTGAPQLQTPPSGGRDRGDSETTKELRLARISLCIVWLFIFCHVWKLIPTVYETFFMDVSVNSTTDDWPDWLKTVGEVSNTVITINSSLNFLIYVLL